MFKPLFALIFLVASLPAWADTRYVIDELSVNMRKGMGTDFAINAILKSGDQVNVLGDDGSGYSRVRTADGKVGYVLTRFLSREPTGKVRADRMLAQLEELKQKNAALEEALVKARTGAEQAGSKNSSLVEERDKLKARLDWIEEASANSVRLANENQSLRERIHMMETELVTLKQENQEIKSWYKGQKIGAVILCVGLFLGWLMGRMRRPNSAWRSDSF